MQKVDMRKRYHDLYSPPSQNVQEAIVPKLQFAMVDGSGVPEDSAEFQDAIGALYGVSYTLKFGRKKGQGPDYTIGPLEGLWWMENGSDFDMAKSSDWRWTLMIMQPDFITQDEFSSAVEVLKTKKPNPALARLRLEDLEEGLVVQIMNVGPYDKEGPNIEKMAEYAKQHGYVYRGLHHEIYMGDPRRAKPEKLKTILRHPIEPAKVIAGT